MLSFEEGLEKLKGRPSRKLEHNTFLVKIDEDTLGVKLHETFVVYIFRSGRYQLDTGGWKTVTTKERMNKYSPAKVYQKNNLWFVGDGLFEDGIRLDADGTVLTLQRKAADVESKQRKLNRMVKKYIKGFEEHVLANGLKHIPSKSRSPWDLVELTEDKKLWPTKGDCWACYFGISSDDPMKEPLGVSHLLEHMQEEYYVPSLLWKAIAVAHVSPNVYWSILAEAVSNNNANQLHIVLTRYFQDRKLDMLELM